MSNSLLDRWLAVLRASASFAQGRECDFAMSEHDADRFDPIGLLAIAAGDDLIDPRANTGWRTTNGEPGVAPGAWLTRHAANELGRHVGLTPNDLALLCVITDFGATGAEVADWVEERTR